MTESRRVLLVAPNPRLTFVSQDLETLSRVFEVRSIWREDYRSEKGTILAVFRMLLRSRFDLLVLWFAEPYDAPWLVGLARIFGVPSVLIVGGYETANLPDLEYGSMRNARSRGKLRAALRWSNLVLPTSELLANEVRGLEEARRIEVIYPGIDCDLFEPGSQPRQDLVVTVATISEGTIRLKGLDQFANLSCQMPEYSFAILGPSLDDRLTRQLRQIGGPNLQIEGRRLTSHELVDWYQKAKVYVQLSARESFGVALAEAMSCGCRPVTSDRGALPEVVGNAGISVPYGDLVAAQEAIHDAMNRGASSAARLRIRENFDDSIRKAKLLAVLDSLH